MKIYAIYLISKNTLYAITDKKKYMEQFLFERNSKLFKVIIKKMDDDDAIKFLDKNKFLKLNNIVLEDSDGNCSIMGTIQEDDILGCICEKMSDSCNYFKLHFSKNVPFNNEYKELLEQLTTIAKNVNNHPVIQIDSVKLFYHLFKETFINSEEYELLNDNMEDDSFDYIEKYKIYY